jgi:hypothetical protein
MKLNFVTVSFILFVTTLLLFFNGDSFSSTSLFITNFVHGFMLALYLLFSVLSLKYKDLKIDYKSTINLDDEKVDKFKQYKSPTYILTLVFNIIVGAIAIYSGWVMTTTLVVWTMILFISSTAKLAEVTSVLKNK